MSGQLSPAKKILEVGLQNKLALFCLLSHSLRSKKDFFRRGKCEIFGILDGVSTLVAIGYNGYL